MSISRRKFLQGSAVATAALSVSPAGATELFSPVKRIPHASHFGAFYADVQDGKIVGIVPHESDKRPGSFTQALVDRNYSNSRIKYPYVRKTYLEGKAGNNEFRGNDEFVRVSWEEALDLVAKEIKDTPKENIYNGSYSGWSHPGRLNSCPTLGGKFFNIVKKGAVGTSGEYSNGAAGPTNPGIMGDYVGSWPI